MWGRRGAMASASQPGSQAQAWAGHGSGCAHGMPCLVPAQPLHTLTRLRMMAEISPPSGLRSSTRRRVHSMPCAEESKRQWA